jgi:hypothetical protein
MADVGMKSEKLTVGLNILVGFNSLLDLADSTLPHFSVGFFGPTLNGKSFVSSELFKLSPK